MFYNELTVDIISQTYFERVHNYILPDSTDSNSEYHYFQVVAVLIDESRPAGPYATVWNGKDKNGTAAASGVYFYRLTAGKKTISKKMILLR